MTTKEPEAWLLVCPFCGHDRFIRREEELATCRIKEDGECIEDIDIDYTESTYTYTCKNCKKDVSCYELKRGDTIKDD